MVFKSTAPWVRYADGAWHALAQETDHPDQTRDQAVRAARAWAKRNGHTAEVSVAVKDGGPAWMLRMSRPQGGGSGMADRPEPRPLGAEVALVRYTDTTGMSPEQLAAEAYRLHCRAVDWNTIAVELDYPTVAAAQRAAADHVGTMGTPDRVTTTAAMLDQLDRALYRSLEVLDATHVKLYKGRVVMDAPDPDDPDRLVPLVDSGPTLAAASTIKGLLTTKAELLGLNAPTQHEHTLVPLPPTVATWVESKRLDRPEAGT